MLSTEEDGSTNLIMDSNICNNGALASSSNTCLVAWNDSGSSANGPVTAMTYLNNATSAWTNLENLNILYNDEGGHFEDFRITGKARMPYYNEINNMSSNENDYLYVNLGGPDSIVGYWSLSTWTSNSSFAHVVSLNGSNSVVSVDAPETRPGVRPVINVKL